MIKIICPGEGPTTFIRVHGKTAADPMHSPNILMSGFHPYEHRYSPGNADIYACEPQYCPGLTSMRGTCVYPWYFYLRFPPYEHRYQGNTDIYACEPQYYPGLTSMRGTKIIHDTFMLGTDICACEPQYYQGKTYINARDQCLSPTLLCQVFPT